MIHSFLMVGQSNMAGRGFLKEVPMICNERIKMLRNGRWQIMTEPINFDRPYSGVGPAASFAAAWCKKNQNDEIGLIPCAEGSTSIDDWSEDGALFKHAILQAKLAKENSKLDGILWHQGENECAPGRYKLYYDKFLKVLEAFRRELDEPNIPIIMGGIGEYLDSGFLGSYFPEHSEVTQVIMEFAKANKNCYFVTASGLTPNPDGIHINAASQRVFGLRYFEAYDKLQHILEPIEGEENAVNIDSDRTLTKTEKLTILEGQFAGGHIPLDDYLKEMSKINS
ncbi:sialate O-acetylesterase [Clostridium sp. YIM B02505]|uniref:Sialate O-acetylesterase n=1 Tax=Clostridium yunnanense TaxID=2800325 RepID=A0ABS1ETT7_9CLOT|nr:sialate O-acetylesterase [Clostridium yunnanense]MBK1812806.1 sialate O-acetylesterase [Clostridium yunnanense]